MKKIFFISLLFFVNVIFSQKKNVKKIQTKANEINIYTEGLDNIILENSNSGFLEVHLYAESYNEQFIFTEELNNELNIKFDFDGNETREVIFRKFITKRLQRANAIIKIPEEKINEFLVELKRIILEIFDAKTPFRENTNKAH